MMMRVFSMTFFALFVAGLIYASLHPHFDLTVSGLFYEQGKGFYWADEPVFNFFHRLAIKGGWYLGGALFLALPVSYFRPTGFLGLHSKSWLFVLLALLIGPVLIANLGFKDHWGRERPREVTEFGGKESFSPALSPRLEHEGNGSFVSGDGAFGSYLHSFAYLVPVGTRRRQSRYAFWGLMAVGAAFGATRIIMGAHFISDVLFAALFMFASAAALHATLFGWRSTRDYWRNWLGFDN